MNFDDVNQEFALEVFVKIKVEIYIPKLSVQRIKFKLKVPLIIDLF